MLRHDPFIDVDSPGFPLPRLRGHRFRGNDVLKIDIYLPISNLKSITYDYVLKNVMNLRESLVPGRGQQ
jgi:hypothetical protein